MSPAKAGATYKLRTAGSKGAHSSTRSPPLPGAQSQKKHLNNKYQQQWPCNSYAKNRGFPKPAGNLIPNMQMGTLRNARPGQGWRSSSCQFPEPTPVHHSGPHGPGLTSRGQTQPAAAPPFPQTGHCPHAFRALG